MTAQSSHNVVASLSWPILFVVFFPHNALFLQHLQKNKTPALPSPAISQHVSVESALRHI